MPGPIPSLLVASFLSYHGYRKKSLSISGSIAAFVVGILTMGLHSSSYFMWCLLVFYFSGSRVTKINAEYKKNLEEGFHEAGHRNAIQVLSNSLTGVILVILHYHLIHSTAFRGAEVCETDDLRWWSNFIIVAYLGHYACCAGDTFASEIGTAFRSQNPLDKSTWPVLITTFKKVPHGTNGGVTAHGTLASLLGGVLIGLTGYMSTRSQEASEHGICIRWSPIEWCLVGALAGVGGSLIDSVLGAALQETRVDKETMKIQDENSHPLSSTIVKVGGKKATDGATEEREISSISGWKVLDNNQVNFVSSCMTAVLLGLFMNE
ncbi:integral membrane protein DUF92-domain-containing protein [Paraphysoderma sedebokerense]|nr:integral membrane protein DUF92-domain-containing protein [Paraphysoderma sedebokerense]